MAIRVRCFATIREHVGTREVSVSTADETAYAVLERLERERPELDGLLLDESGDVRSSVTVLVNGKTVPADELPERRVSDGDVIGLTPPLTGG